MCIIEIGEGWTHREMTLNLGHECFLKEPVMWRLWGKTTQAEVTVSAKIINSKLNWICRKSMWLKNSSWKECAIGWVWEKAECRVL